MNHSSVNLSSEIFSCLQAPGETDQIYKLNICLCLELYE